MASRRTYKMFFAIVFSIVAVSLLPGVVIVWAEVDLGGNEIDPTPVSFKPHTQGDELISRPPSDFSDVIVQFGERESIFAQSNSSEAVTVPGAAFVHTNELGNSTEAEDWFFFFNGGYLTNDSLVVSGVPKPICLMAPAYLPQGSLITRFTVFLYDNYPVDDIAVFLDRTSSFGEWTELAAVQSAENSASIQTLTDPSIFSENEANLVAPEFNYHVSLCLPAGSDDGIRVYGAQVNYIIDPGSVYLPIIQKSKLATPTPQPKSEVFITNRSGGSVNYTILNTPEGNINCIVPDGAVKQFCDKSFTPGTYNWQAQLQCGNLGPKLRIFTPGDNFPADFRCD